MQYRTLGKTDIKVSEIGMGCEGFEGKPFKECEQLLDFAMQNNINFFDLYTSNPEVRRNLGSELKKYPRNKFIIQGHLCTIWEDGQYCRTRDIDKIIPSFEQILTLMQIEYVDIGMVHYVDDKNDFDIVMNGPIIEYAKQLKQKGIIKSIGLSTHNTDIALLAAKSGIMDVIMFSINPAYDMLPANEDVNIFFEESTYDRVYEGIDPKREELYQTCQNNGIALTVMKPFAGGLLLDEKQSPFGKAMTPIQCISYCLDRPSVASVLGGMASIDQVKQAVDYCTASEKQRDYS